MQQNPFFADVSWLLIFSHSLYQHVVFIAIQTACWYTLCKKISSHPCTNLDVKRVIWKYFITWNYGNTGESTPFGICASCSALSSVVIIPGNETLSSYPLPSRFMQRIFDSNNFFPNANISNIGNLLNSVKQSLEIMNLILRVSVLLI